MGASVSTMESVSSLAIPCIKRHHETRIKALSLTGKRVVFSDWPQWFWHVKCSTRRESE